MTELLPTYVFLSGMFGVNTWEDVYQTFGVTAPGSGWYLIATGGYTWETLVQGTGTSNDVLAASYDRSAAGLFNELERGEATFILDNQDGRYSPERNSAVRPNQTVVFRAVHSGTTYDLFTGRTTTIQVDPMPGRQTVTIRATDELEQLRKKLNLGIQTDMTISSLTSLVLSAAGIPHNVDENLTDVAPFVFFDDQSAGEMLREILKSGNHRAYVDGMGVVQVRDRNFDVLASPASSLVNVLLDYGYEVSAEGVINDARVSGAFRAKTSDIRTVAWVEPSTVQVNSGQSAEFFVAFVDPENRETQTPCGSVVTPIMSADWTWNSQADNSGTVVTSWYTLTFTPYAQTAYVSFTNVGTVNAYLTAFNVRGHPYQRQPTFFFQNQVFSSQAIYDRRSFTLENELLGGINVAKTYSEFLTTRFKNPVAKLNVTMRNLWPDTLSVQPTDFVSIVESVSAVGDSWWVTRTSHLVDFRNQGLLHTATWELEEKFLKEYLILDHPTFGKLDERRLGF